MKNCLPLIFVFIVTLFVGQAAAQQHPRIWVSDSDRERILANIDQYEWAASLKSQLEKRVDPWSTRHKTNPQYLLSRLPRTWGGQNYTDADLAKKDANRPYAVSGNASIPTFHRSDDYIIRPSGGGSYDYPGIEGMVPYNSNPYYGMELTISGTDRKEFVPYIARFLRNVYTDVLMLGVDSAVLYYLTGREEYAQLSADILHAFVEPLAVMNTVNNASRNHASGILITNFLRDARITYPMFPLMYDMVYPFLKKSGTTVYDAVSKSRESFNENAAQKTFTKLARVVLDKGIKNSNWSILEGDGFLYNLLSISNTQDRNRLFSEFYNDGTEKNHDSFMWSLANFTSENLWPESMLYSFDVNIRMLRMMNIIDRNKSLLGVDVFAVSPKMLDGPFVYENLEYPNQRAMRFGDSDGERFAVQEIYADVLTIAQRKGLTEDASRAEAALANQYQQLGSYTPTIVDERLGYYSPLQLLWGSNVDLSKAKEPKKESALHISHAGVFMQRNYNTKDIRNHGLMYYTGGATYVHAHASGIDLEIYGAGDVMGVDIGTLGYGKPEHEKYTRLQAGHNTVVVNGFAKPGEGGWDNIMNNTQLLSAEPAAFATPIAENYSFSCQALDDKINNSDHQRCVGMIRTSSTSGYYVDVFRAKSKDQDNFSDYIYHNIGDSIVLTDLSGKSVALNNTPNRYQNDVGDAAQSPGWRFFEGTRTTSPTSTTLKAQFNVDGPGRYMHAFMPGGDGNREVSLATGPATPKAEDGYHRKPTQIMTIRKQGAAWTSPYVVVFEPSLSPQTTIKDTSLIRSNGDVVGVVIESEFDNVTIKDIVLSHDAANKTYESANGEIKFTGRFAVIREMIVAGNTTVQLYIGDGQNLTYQDKTITGGINRKAFKDFAGGVPNELVLKRFSFVAHEGETISATTPVDIAYGAEGAFIFSPNRRGNIICTNSMCMKDPNPGVAKSCYIREAKTSYRTSPITLPGVIEAEHYDYGGQDISYSDKSAENKGAADANFRVNDGVDVGLGNGGLVLGWIGNDEWTEYTVDIQQAGSYELAYTYSAAVSDGRIGISVDGTSVSSVNLPITGSESTFDKKTSVAELPQGKHVIRVNFEIGEFNLDKIEFNLTNAN